MPLIEWTDELTIGVSAVDADHRKLIGLVNFLYDSMMSGKGHEVLEEFLDSLIVYTKEHFDREETFFKTADYPNTTAHRAEHNELIKQMLDVQAKYKSGTRSALTLEMIGFLNKWLVDHIRTSDKKYAPYLHSKGIN